MTARSVCDCRSVKWFWFWLLLLSGCASFSAPVTISGLLRPHHSSAANSANGLDVSVEDYSSSEKSLKAFDTDLPPLGILPLLIQITNHSTTNYVFHQKDVAVFLDGRRLPQIAAIDVARQAVEREAAVKAAAWTLAAGPFALLLWPATIGVSVNHTIDVNNRIESHFQNFEIGNAIVKPGQSVGGFIFIGLPEGTQVMNKMKVRVLAENENLSEKNRVELALPEITLAAPVVHPLFSTAAPPVE